MLVSELIDNETVFEKIISKGNNYLKFIGLKLDGNDANKKLIDRLRLRRLFIFIFIYMNIDVSGQLIWLIGNVISDNSDLIDITFLLPCLTVSFLGSVKCFYFFKYSQHIHEIIRLLNKLQTTRLNTDRSEEDKFEKRSMVFLNIANKIIIWGTVLGLTAFGVGPLLLTAVIFYNTNEIKLFLPFLFYYPFDPYDIRVWPILYLQQVWSSIIPVCTIWGPDYVCHAIATCIIIQFYYLKQDIVSLIRKGKISNVFVANDAHREKLKKIVKRHNDLLRSVELMEAAYTKPILINVITSSMLICFNVFNITTSNNIVFMTPYTAFLVIVLGQIFLLCYFCDMIMRSSMEVGDAVYKCHWYGADLAAVRDLMIISLRSNKPCKLTACGYSDVNLRTFTKILSTSWSYLALLQTVYKKLK